MGLKLELGVGLLQWLGFILAQFLAIDHSAKNKNKKKIKKRDTMKKLDTTTEMKAIVKICARWKYAKAHNVGDALQSTLIRDARTELNKAS